MSKSYKKIVYLLFILMFITSLVGCNVVNEFKEGYKDGVEESTKDSDVAVTDKVIKSSDGSTQITVNSNWKESTSLNDEASIQVDQQAKEKYAIVISESVEDFADDFSVDEYANMCKDLLSESIKNSTVSEFTDMTINGLPAKYYEIKGEIEKIKVCYFIVAVKGEKGLHQVVGWTINSKYDENKEEIKKILQSFKEL